MIRYGVTWSDGVGCQHERFYGTLSGAIGHFRLLVEDEYGSGVTGATVTFYGPDGERLPDHVSSASVTVQAAG